VRLKVTGGMAVGTDIEVEEQFVIGRTSEYEQGTLGDDPELSRQHARVSRSGEGFLIEDLGSMNGTLLNGRRITGPEPLSNGDTIDVGGSRIVVEMEAAPPPPPPIPEAGELGATRVSPVQPTPTGPPPPPAGPPEPPPPPPAPPPPPPPPAPEAPAPPPPPEPEPQQPTAESFPPPPPPGATPASTDTVEPAAEPPPRGRVVLRVEIDFDAGEASIALEEGAEGVRLVEDEGGWRLEPGD
jgi:pSer/pThr/pTyr-binding forkhead associated (FHA) protein